MSAPLFSRAFATLVWSWTILVLALGGWLPASALANPPTSGLATALELQGITSGGGEYMSGNYQGAILMPVNLWGAALKPGIHHIPTQTDFLTFLAVAGGPSIDAELDHITIKRRSQGGKEEVFRVNANDLLENTGRQPLMLEPNDIIVIPRDKPVISNNAVTVMSFVGGMIGLILAGFALSSQFKK